MKVYVKRDGKLHNVVIFMGGRVAAKTGVLGQDLGGLIDSYTNGVYEEIDKLPDGMVILKGVISWRC